MTQVVSSSVAWAGTLWMHRACKRLYSQSRALSHDELDHFGKWLPADTLERVCIVECDDPIRCAELDRWLRLIRRESPNAIGLALKDTVLLQEKAWTRSVLFHELVHIVQYNLLGVRRFLSSYLKDARRQSAYPFGIALESQAYAMQDRYDSGEVFDLRAEVEASIRAD